MNRLQNILAVVDLSPCSRAALAQAARLSTWNKARLHVLYGVDELDLIEAAEAMKQPFEAFQEVTLKGAEAALKQMMRRTKLPAGTAYRIEVGPIIELLLRVVNSTSADLVVMGVRGTPDGPNGAGMLATRALRKTRTKVMLVEEGKTRRFRRIIACIDFSETSREVVIQTLRVARQDRSQVRFVHVFFAPWRRFGFRTPSPSASLNYAQEHRLRLLERLRAWVGDTGPVRSSFEAIDADNPAMGIARYAQEAEADLIVLGRRGRTELGYLLMGSTVERLARELSCCLLTVQRVEDPLSRIAGMNEPAETTRN